jgi:hypothetical protein
MTHMNSLLRSAAIASVFLTQWAMTEPAVAGNSPAALNTPLPALDYCVALIQPTQGLYQYVLWFNSSAPVFFETPEPLSMLTPPTQAQALNFVSCITNTNSQLPIVQTPDAQLCATGFSTLVVNFGPSGAPIRPISMATPPLSGSWPSTPCPTTNSPSQQVQ